MCDNYCEGPPCRDWSGCKDPVKMPWPPSALSDGLCGCGKKGRYLIKEEMACNKHMRCPTYKQLSDEVIRVKQALWLIKKTIDETPI